MIMCSICKENVAVVFITKFLDGKKTQEGICLSCAKKQGISPINQIFDKTGLDDGQIEDLNKQVNEILENIDIEELKNSMINISDKNIDSVIQEYKDFSNENNKNTQSNKSESKSKIDEDKNTKKKKYLDTYGTNLTDIAREGKLDNIIGREKEMERVIQILNRRNKNNPVLIGEPGVGKTAITEALAQKIIEKKVPHKFFNTEIYLINMTSVVAGSQFRGQFESRMKGIIEEATALGNVILVIDELHNIMGAGEADGAMNAGNILKPALSKGSIQVIGATTFNEYRKHIEKDSALERRFQPIFVEEPSVEESIQILEGLKKYYEKFHKIVIDSSVIEAAVILAERYIHGRFLPDKAIDVLDEAGSVANLKNTRLSNLETLKEELKEVQNQKESAISADSIEDYQKAADLKIRECKLVDTIKDIEDVYKDDVLTTDDIAKVIESWTKIPVSTITEDEAKKLLDLEERIHKSLVGQHEPVVSIARAIRRNRANFKKKKRPSSFIFVGPTGVGKTELVKILALELFGSKDTLIRLDMSEYMEKHTVSKLIGSPPGYVGYDEAGQFTEKVRRNPYSVILLDEIEKAHPDVFNMLLQILEDGRLTDSHGRTINFENTIIILTSNAGTSLKSNGIGFGNESYSALEMKVKDVLKETFRPEFLNRIDEVIVFKELNKEELKSITRLMLDEVRVDAKEKSIHLSFTENLVEFILEKGYDIKFGARPLRKTIQRYVEDELSEAFLKGRIKEGQSITIDYVDEKVMIRELG